jgi:hypothetical protein
MYFADIASSLELFLKDCAGWRARSIMPEVFGDGNVEKRAAVSYQLSVKRKTSTLRPLLRAMQNTGDFDDTTAEPVNRKKRCARDHKLASLGFTALTAKVREFPQ